MYVCMYVCIYIYVCFVTCNSHYRDVPGFFGEHVGFLFFWACQGFEGPGIAILLAVLPGPAMSQGGSNVSQVTCRYAYAIAILRFCRL